MRTSVIVLCFALGIFVGGSSIIKRNSPATSNRSLSQIIDSLNIDESSLKVVIDKSDYRLSFYSEEDFLKSYPVVFGGNPRDDKLMQGDQCTPEGTFKIRSKYPHKSWNKFIWIDYPNKESWKKHNGAMADGKIPSNASIGGEIGIHGVPKGMDYLIDRKQNWTLGCISLKNADIDEIYPYFTPDIKVTIEK